MVEDLEKKCGRGLTNPPRLPSCIVDDIVYLASRFKFEEAIHLIDNWELHGYDVHSLRQIYSTYLKSLC